MYIHNCTDYETMSQASFKMLVTNLAQGTNQLLCAATGYSPQGLYAKLGAANLSQPALFQTLKIIKLDEWGGIAETDKSSCESFISKYLLEPLQIPEERYISFRSNPKNPQEECFRIQEQLNHQGPIDLCVLGLGKNGHLGFNEPGEILNPHCHIASLTTTSLNHTMVNDKKVKPTYGLTLGMADIMKSKKIILLVTGADKKEVISQLLTKKVSTQLPASLLWLHPNVHCFIDKSAT